MSWAKNALNVARNILPFCGGCGVLNKKMFTLQNMLYSQALFDELVSFSNSMIMCPKKEEKCQLLYNTSTAL